MTKLRYENTFYFIYNKYDEVIQRGCINLDNMNKNNKKGNKKKYINIFPIMKILLICLLLSLADKSNDNAYNKDMFQKDKGNCSRLRYNRLLSEPIFEFDVMYDLFKDNFLEQIGYSDAQKNELKLSMKSFFQSSNSQEYTYSRREDNIHSISNTNVTNVKSVKFEEPQDKKNLITIEEINAGNNDSEEKKNEPIIINVDENKNLESVISNEQEETTTNNEGKKKKTKKTHKNKGSSISYDNIEENEILKENNVEVEELIEENRELIKKGSIYKNKLKEKSVEKRIKGKNYLFHIIEKAKEIPPGVIVGLFSIFYVALGENRSSLILLIVIFILALHAYLEVKRICRFLDID
ncbi:Plasmodium exported protein (hyp2), unknown function [Plasmodium sp. DRC-Itaito]|nr:Plasmodium exported protein (hyp2), unknown function [Plasmodium sp. DRC-Itaito]